MNAAKVESKSKFQDQIDHPRKYKCEACDKKQAVVAIRYYDIFSDEISGVDLLCRKCDERRENYGDEGYFECSHCYRRMIENITWELYYKVTDDGLVCLKCAAEEYFSDEANLIDPKLVKWVVLKPTGFGDDLFDHEDGTLNLAKAPHVLGVEQPIPEGWEFVTNAEYDSMDGHQISGFAFEEKVKELDRPFLVVLDGAYQFAVSIGIYQKTLTDGEKVAATIKQAQEALG